MKTWLAAALTALLLSILTIVGLFLFYSYMASWERYWRENDVVLSGSQESLLVIARWWGTYWYVALPFVFLAYLVAFSLLAWFVVMIRKRREAQKEDR